MRLWSFIFVLALATSLGVFISQDPGYAFFVYGNWTVEMPLWVSGVLIILITGVLVFFVWVFNTIFSSSDRVRFWWKRRKEHAARLQTNRGLLELAEGRWQQAERFLIRGAIHNDTPLINYLSAAEAAEELGYPEKRNRYLEMALALSSNSDIAARLTQAQLQLKHGEIEEAIKNLELLYAESPKHPKVLRLLCNAYEITNDWEGLFALLPQLNKTQAFSKNELWRLQQKLYPNLLPIYANKGSKALIAFWEKTPRALQSDLQMLHTYVTSLMQQSASDVAEFTVRSALKSAYHNDLIYLYGLIDSEKVDRQLSFAESLISEHQDNPYLFLTLGRLCLRNQLWGKARNYFEQSLAIEPITETYAELGQLMGQLGLADKQEEYFKKGLLSITQAKHFHPPEFSRLCLSYEDKLEQH